ncbi:hypothetical protein TNIN_261501 [Trichonephila inaurata madagascariensis]|uniref:Uncharacterized protein n=1 Tax=Trichonephila inaurata madagascariensis TaxID=2747483 RepID=A0A8X6X2L3_9ARAC|nr:hypothetical protein TNIN_261501 [Trichonephila inaurata madagascariensis]
MKTCPEDAAEQYAARLESEKEQAGRGDGCRPSSSRNRGKNERQQQRSTLMVSISRERVTVHGNRTVNLSGPDNVMSGAAGDRNIEDPSRLPACPDNVQHPVIGPEGAACPDNVLPPIGPAGAAHPDNLPPQIIGPAGDIVRQNLAPVQVPPAQHARCLCVVCQRYFNVIVPDGPRICPNFRQNEDEDLNPMVEREQRQ